MDIISNSNFGYPGISLDLATCLHVLWTKFIKYDANWINRDRFVLSCGNASPLLYSILHLYTNKLTVDDLKEYCRYQSKTPANPENKMNPEIEITTGIPGQGIANAVGLAIASLHIADRFNKKDIHLFNNNIYCIVSNRDLMEGVQYEAISFAGHQKLGNLVVIWDNNRMVENGSIDSTFSEDVVNRFKACGWHTIKVENGNTNIKAITTAIEDSMKIRSKPVFIDLHVKFGFGCENNKNIYDTPLSKEDLLDFKKKLGFSPSDSFIIPEKVAEYYENAHENVLNDVEIWNSKFQEYESKYPKDFEELKQIIDGNFDSKKFKFFIPMTNGKSFPTSISSGKIINVLVKNIPGFIGGTADLTKKTYSELEGQTSFQPENRKGRFIEFGVREHAMHAIANGIAAYGFKGLVPFISTFLVCLQNAFPALRIASIDKLRVISVVTYDSIGAGEEGTTYQNVENFAMIRALPNTVLMRPADLLEVGACYTYAFTSDSRPVIIALSKQNTANMEGGSFDGALKGGYIRKKVDNPKLVIASTGTELTIAFNALKMISFPVQIVSIPCMKAFNEQSIEYKRSCFPYGVPVLSVEAGVSFGWLKYSHKHCGIETFGMSAPSQDIYKHFSLTPEDVAEKAKMLVEYYNDVEVPDLLGRP